MLFDQPNRREIITLVGGAMISWPLAVRAQQPTKIVRIGVLASLPLPPLQRFSHKLREYGYVEGQNSASNPVSRRDGTTAIQCWRRSSPRCRSTSS